MPIVGVPARPVAVADDEHLNGSKHADNSVDLQEFMVMPVGAPTFVDELDICARSSESPVISSGFGKPMRSSSVGEISANRPDANPTSPPPMSTTGTGFVVCDVCGPPVPGSRISSQLP
jgi:hypothetical protein